MEVFALAADPVSLEAILRDLFENHWQDITFGPIIQGAAWEMQAASAPTQVGMLDGYITIAFGAPHFHLCIGEHKGLGGRPVSEELARHRRTARAELYRQLDSEALRCRGACVCSTAKASNRSPSCSPIRFSRPRIRKC